MEALEKVVHQLLSVGGSASAGLVVQRSEPQDDPTLCLTSAHRETSEMCHNPELPTHEPDTVDDAEADAAATLEL